MSNLSSDHWITLFNSLKLEGITKSICSNCILDTCEGNALTLILDESQAAIYNEAHEKRIQQALSAFFASDIELKIRVANVGQETPAAYRERRRKENKQAAVDSFTNDETVKALVERFKGSIMIESIEALKPEEF